MIFMKARSLPGEARQIVRPPALLAVGVKHLFPKLARGAGLGCGATRQKTRGSRGPPADQVAGGDTVIYLAQVILNLPQPAQALFQSGTVAGRKQLEGVTESLGIQPEAVQSAWCRDYAKG